MKKIIIATTLIVTCFLCQTNETKAQAGNAFYVELLGNGLIFSANYDMRFNKESVAGLGARLGVGYVGGDEASVFTVPIMANYLLGKDGKYLEVGAGITYVAGSTNFGDGLDDGVIGTMSFQYRKQPVDGGFMWKIGFTPVLAEGTFIPWWPGLSIGYSW